LNSDVEAHLPINKNAIPGIFYNPLEKQNPFINNNPQNFLSSVFQQLPNYPERISTPAPNHDLAFGLFNNTNNNNSHATSNSMFLQQETLLNSSLRSSQLLPGAGGVQPKTLEELFQKSTLITTPRSTAPSVFSSTPSPYLQMNNYSLSSYQNAPLHSAESLLTLSPAFGQARPPMNNPSFPLQHDQSSNRELVSQLVEVLKRDNQNKVRTLLETLIVPQSGSNVSPGINQNNMNMGMSRERSGVGFGPGLESLLAQPKNLVSQVQDIPPQRFTPIQKNQDSHHQVKEEQKKLEKISSNTTNALNDIVQRLGGPSHKGTLENKIDLILNFKIDNKDIVQNLEMLVINEEAKGFEQEEEEEQVEMESYRQRGVYSKEERRQKILKYKNKIAKWRNSHPVKRAFSGRSNVAGKKPRIKGKFVSIEEYQKYAESQAK